MHFTREPITETIITPREGFKLVVRNSKGVGQEEYFVDALEIVTFGSAIFYRSIEKPKAFLLAVSDYDVVEVRDTRLVLKHTSVVEKTIKIGGGKELSPKKKEEQISLKKKSEQREQIKELEGEEEESLEAEEEEVISEGEDAGVRAEKRRERRRHSRKKRSQQEQQKYDESVLLSPSEGGDVTDDEKQPISSSTVATIIPPPRALIPPPSTLISDKYRLERAAEKVQEPLHIEEHKADEESPKDDSYIVANNVEKEESPVEEVQEKPHRKVEEKAKRQPRLHKKPEEPKEEQAQKEEKPPKPKEEKEVFPEKTQSFASLLDEEFD